MQSLEHTRKISKSLAPAQIATLSGIFGIGMVISGMEIGGAIVISSSIIASIFMDRTRAGGHAEKHMPEDMDAQIAREEEGDLKVINWEIEQMKRRSA